MKARSKLLLSAAALTASLAVATTGTFAWFSTNATPKVSEFQVTVQQNAGVKVALRNSITGYQAGEASSNYSTFATTISKDQIDGVIGNAVVMQALSSSDKGKTLSTNAFTDGATDIEVTPTAATANVDYASFILRFSTGTENMKIKYAPTADTFKGDAGKAQAAGIAWESTQATDSVNANVKDVARVSMVTLNGSSEVASFKNTTTTDRKYGESGLAWAIFKNEMGLTKTNPTIAADQAATTETVLGTVGALTVDDGTKVLDVQVNVWLDGWDGNCFNSVMGSILKVALGFTAAV